MGSLRICGHYAAKPSLRRAASALALAAVCLEPTLLGAQAYAAVSHPATHSTKPPDRRAHAAVITPWEAAERSRDAFEATPEIARTRPDYTRVMDRFRAVYHDNPRDVHAPEAINAVAELLAEGQIAENDLHDAALARERYQLLLTSYPKSALAEQAQAGLASLSNRQRAGAALAATAGDPRAAASHAKTGEPAVGQAGTSQAASIGQAAAAGPAGGAGQIAQPSSQPAAPIVRSQRTGDAASANRVSAEAASRSASLSDQGGTALPPPRQVAHRSGPLASVSGIRHWSTSTYTRVAIDLGDQVEYEAARVPSPDRIFFDLHGAHLAQDLVGKSFAVTDEGFLKRIRVSQSAPDVARVVLDVNDVTEYSAFLLPNPYRLIIDIHGRSKSPGAQAAAPQQLATIDAPAPRSASVPNTHAMHAGSPTDVNNLSSQPGKIEATSTPTSQPIAATVAGRDRSAELTQSHPNEALEPNKSIGSSVSTLPVSQPSGSAANLSGRSQPTSAAAASSAAVQAGPSSSPQPLPVAGFPSHPAGAAGDIGRPGTSTAATRADTRVVGDPNPATTARAIAAVKKSGKKGSKTLVAADTHPVGDLASPARAAALKTADGQTSLVRALGLKINRIVIDAGHGGHDSGTLGVDGIQEKDVVLDVALRLGALLHDKLGAEVIYTRSDDTFIPLETRTAIANKAQADLFLSIHANSSPDASARGVETYYLNFTQQADALEVAARENAVSGQSVSQLSDLVRKITLKDKIAESREFATDVEGSLYAGLARAPENLRVSTASHGSSSGNLKDRGVKKAPFVVLIGANMPSILAEISFVTNPRDAALLREPDYKQRVAESLYKGVARYVGSLSSTAPAPVPTERAATGQ